MKSVILAFLRGYKKFVSPIFVATFGNACRFTPTCSTYTIQSVERHGVVKGLWLGFLRILKCNPFTKV